MRRTFLGAACLTVAILAASFMTVAESSFGDVTLDTILQATLSSYSIDGSPGSSNQIPAGSLLAYRTDEGRYGVLEIVSCGQDLVVNWRTYAIDGSVFGSGVGLLIHGTWTCDLDRGIEGSASADFQWSIVTSTERYIEPRGGAQFALLTDAGIPLDNTGGVYLPQPRLAYSVLPPRSFSVVIPSVTIHMDLRTSLPLGKREWTQWGISIPAPAGTLSETLQCICSQHYMEKWEVKPASYWPHAKQYLISDPTPGHWDTFALCIDVPNLTWGTGAGYGVSIVPSSVFTNYRAGSGVLVPASQKIAISPAPTVETGPMSARGGPISSPYILAITFHQVVLEWFAWTGEAYLRVGDVVLMTGLGVQWSTTDPNTIRITPGFGTLVINLHTGAIQYENWKAGTPPAQTLLTVNVDDGPTNFIPYNPSLWW